MGFLDFFKSAPAEPVPTDRSIDETKVDAMKEVLRNIGVIKSADLTPIDIIGDEKLLDTVNPVTLKNDLVNVIIDDATPNKNGETHIQERAISWLVDGRTVTLKYTPKDLGREAFFTIGYDAEAALSKMIDSEKEAIQDNYSA